MTTTEAKQRIQRFNAGGNLFDFSNWYLKKPHLQEICDSLIYTDEKKAFLSDVREHARLGVERKPLFSREYKTMRRRANQMLFALEHAPPQLF